MKTYNLKKKQSQGFTIIELMVGVAIIAIVGVGILVAANLVSAGLRADEAKKQILAIQTGIKEQFPSPNRAGLTIGVLVRAKKVPDNMIDAAGTGANNAWGGTILAAPFTIGTGATNGGYAIDWPLVPARECNSIVQGLAANFAEISVGTAVVKNATTAPTGDSIATACLANNETNVLQFRGT